jgi:hypothetical protein
VIGKKINTYSKEKLTISVYSILCICGWVRTEVDTFNISNLVLITVSIIANKNIKKICMKNAIYLLSLMIENVNFFYIHC